MKTRTKTKCFERLVFDLLFPYDAKRLNLIISGGSILHILEERKISTLNTTGWTVYFADERVVPPTDRESNFFNAKTFLSYVKGTVCPIDTSLELGEIKKTYQETLKNATFDLAILGVGEDGHVASIFPGSPVVDSTDLVEVVTDSPKPPATRITVTPRLLTLVQQIVFLIPLLPSGKLKLVKEPHFSILSKINTETLIVTADLPDP